jgi:NarL family two-component system sensor histidine kinase LiaS
MFVQVPKISGVYVLQGLPLALLVSGVFWLLISLIVGGLFGVFTTRGLVHRLQRLVAATSRFAGGDYTQRVHVSQRDEVGQLEEHFNLMAEQLVQSINQRQTLAEQNARLAERSRLARDLHDSVKQQSFAVSMQLGTALALFDVKPEAARPHLEEAESLAYHVQQELTTLIKELRPVALQDRGLPVALQEYVTTWSRQQGIEAEMQITESWTAPLETEEALWRVAQEALSNIARHSRASSVQVALSCDKGMAILAIKDNGQGFDMEKLNCAGVGLHSMEERMQALGGTVKVQSKQGEGTRVMAQCPCEEI